MVRISQRISPCLWFDGQAREAAEFYTSVFPNSRIIGGSNYDFASAEASGQPEGSEMTVFFELDGQIFLALNGGPAFQFTQAISLMVYCDTQAEIDHYWEKLGEGGDPSAQICGWLKDKFGLSWQIVPVLINEVHSGNDPEATARLMQSLIQMKKLDIAQLAAAAAGDSA